MAAVKHGPGRHSKKNAAEKGSVVKKFGVDFYSEYGALTLRWQDVSFERVDADKHSRPHPSGWTIEGVVKSDHCIWVNDFYAVHPYFGKVWGNFEHEVYAYSEEAFQHFFDNHPPKAWDYGDI